MRTFLVFTCRTPNNKRDVTFSHPESRGGSANRPDLKIERVSLQCLHNPTRILNLSCPERDGRQGGETGYRRRRLLGFVSVLILSLQSQAGSIPEEADQNTAVGERVWILTKEQLEGYKNPQTSCKMTPVSLVLYSGCASHTAEHPDETEYYTLPNASYSQLHCPSITSLLILSVPV